MAAVAGNASWRLLGGLCAVALVKVACDGGPDKQSPVDATLAALLADLGPEVVLPALDSAAAAAAALSTATAAWRDAPQDDAARTAAQSAWWSMMTAWQAVELLQIGPAASSLTAVAGADLRDAVYSWPTVNRCRVDQETAYARWDEADFFETSLVNVTGLDAIEVLLYAPAGENDCPAQVDINADGTWAALGADGVQANRAAYAATLAAEVEATVAALRLSWDPAGGDFSGQLAEATPYESHAQALNAVFDALFYLETMTKDRKLGYAVGLGDCAGSTCIDQIESPLAGGSHAWVVVNLASFRALYLGGEGVGMDALLRSLGEDALADAVLAALDAADAAALAVALPLDQAVAADPAPVEALYYAVKGVTDLLRGDVATVLALQIPAEAAGDSD